MSITKDQRAATKTAIRGLLQSAETNLKNARRNIVDNRPGLAASRARQAAEFADSARSMLQRWEETETVDNPRADALLSSPRAPAVGLAVVGGVAILAALLAGRKA